MTFICLLIKENLYLYNRATCIWLLDANYVESEFVNEFTNFAQNLCAALSIYLCNSQVILTCTELGLLMAIALTVELV